MADVVFLDAAECCNRLDIYIIEPVTGIDPQTDLAGQLDGRVDMFQFMLLLVPGNRFGIRTGVDFDIIGIGSFWPP